MNRLREQDRKREENCIDFLNSLPKGIKYVLVGGFAVSSYRFPRHSIDLDMVIQMEDLKLFRKLLKEQGYFLEKKEGDFDMTYEGKFERYAKDEELTVNVDLMIGSIQARQTNYPYSFSYVFRNSEIREIRGRHPGVKSKARTAKREMLIALKINSMRRADKRDIIMLCYEKPDVGTIVRHLKKCPRDIILCNIKDLEETLEKHSLELKSVFPIRENILEKAKGNCLKVLEGLKTEL